MKVIPEIHRVNIDYPSVSRGLRYFSTQES